MKRSDNISVSDKETLDTLIEMGENEGYVVRFNDLSSIYGENYEVFIPGILGESGEQDDEYEKYREEQREAYNQSQIDQFRPKLVFDKASFEKDKKTVQVTLDPKDLNIARVLLLEPDIKAKNLEELLKDALFSYAYRELGQKEVNDLSESALGMYMTEK